MSDFLDEMTACVPALRRYAHALTRDADRADDLVQDCLERAIRKNRENNLDNARQTELRHMNEELATKLLGPTE